MIDISNVILKKVKDAVTATYADCYFTTSNPDSVTKNRVVSMTEVDNTTYFNSLDDRDTEYHARVTFQFDVYSNNTEGKKEEAKAIQNIIDNTMLSLRFTRTMCQPTPNIDRSYYRITSRYEAIVAKDFVNGNGDTINQIYRR